MEYNKTFNVAYDGTNTTLYETDMKNAKVFNVTFNKVNETITSVNKSKCYRSKWELRSDEKK